MPELEGPWPFIKNWYEAITKRAFSALAENALFYDQNGLFAAGSAHNQPLCSMAALSPICRNVINSVSHFVALGEKSVLGFQMLQKHATLPLERR